MHNVSRHMGPKHTMPGVKQELGYSRTKARQAFLPIPQHLESKLPPVPPLFTPEEAEEFDKEHTRLSKDPNYSGYPQVMPSTKEQWERYHHRLEVMRQRRELAMALDSDYRRRVEEGRAELQRQRALEREAGIID